MCLAVLALTASVAMAAPAPRSAALVVYGASAEALEPSLREAASSLKTVTLKKAATTRADVAAAAELGTACGATSGDCLVQLALLMNVDVLLVASATEQAGGASLELAAIEPAIGREVGRERAVVPGGAGRAAALRDVLELLLEPQLHFGVLSVTADQPGALLVIDGAERLERPEPSARIRLRSGPHRVVVMRPGSAPFTADVDVRPGSEVALVATLAPSSGAGPSTTATAAPAQEAETPPLLTAGLVTSAAGLTLAVAGGAVALGIDAGLGAGLGSAAEKEDYQRAGIASLVVAGTGAAAAVAGGVLAWLGAAPPPATTAQSAFPHSLVSPSSVAQIAPPGASMHAQSVPDAQWSSQEVAPSAH